MESILDGKVDIFYDLKLTPREQQIDGVNFLKDSIRAGNRYMLLNLPTGVGKSYLSTMFITWYLNAINGDAKFDILTNSKVLQKQYIRDYPYIRNLEGKANYKCEKYLTNCEDGMEICSVRKTACEFCPYKNAVKNYIASRVSLTNFHMFNICNIYTTSIKNERKANVLIVDEAQDFESVFCDYLSTELNVHNFVKCGFSDTERIKFKNIISSIDTIEDFILAANEDILPALKKQKKWLYSEIGKGEDLDGMLGGSGMQTLLSNETKIKYSKQVKMCEGKINSIEIFLKEYNTNPDNWILEVNHRIDKKSKEEIRTLNVQPVWAHKYIPNYLFNEYDHIIFMSGTILSKNLFCNINGLSKDITTYHSIPSPFPIKNRKIYYIKLGKMTHKEKIHTYERQLETIKRLLNKYKDKKGIIHTANYELATWIQRDLMLTEYGDRLIFHETANRDERLNAHISSEKPSVLVSPSMMTGVDLKDDLSRFQIIMKMPYPNLTSKKIKQRMKTYPDWYLWKTVVDLMQSYGRSVRSEDDFADTIILDSCLTDVLIQFDKYIPRYFTDAITILKL